MMFVNASNNNDDKIMFCRTNLTSKPWTFWTLVPLALKRQRLPELGNIPSQDGKEDDFIFQPPLEIPGAFQQSGHKVRTILSNAFGRGLDFVGSQAV